MAAFQFKRIYQAYLACRKRKRATSQAQHYDLHLLDELVWASESLQNHTWQPRRTACFITTRPKAREIHAAAFADRVIHHLLIPHLEALYEPIFIHDSYSNRKGKGTHKAVKRLQQFMRQVTCNQKRRAYYLQLDIHNFFNSVDKNTLFTLLEKRMTKTDLTGFKNLSGLELLWLCRRILAHNPCLNVKEYGSAKKFAQVPPHKRLKNAPQGKGLPIGNLTSQFFANLYMNELDQFVKHQLKCKYYLRYVDDFILLHENKAQLEVWREAIIVFLHERLALRLKDAGKLQPVSNGSDFLGYIVRPHYCLVRRRVVGNFREKLTHFERDRTGFKNLSGLTELQATIASYLGHFRHASSYRLTRSLWQQYPWLSRYFWLTFSSDETQGVKPPKKTFPKIILSPALHYAQKKARSKSPILFPLEDIL
jgi:hypothetical protein